MLTAEGWPRPVIGGYPIPWVSDSDSLGQMDPLRHEFTLDSLRCQVCGETHDPHGEVHMFLLRVDGPDPSKGDVLARPMDDGVLHKRCAALAFARCPELGRRRRAGELFVLVAPVSKLQIRAVGDEGKPGIVVEGRETSLAEWPR